MVGGWGLSICWQIMKQERMVLTDGGAEWVAHYVVEALHIAGRIIQGGASRHRGIVVHSHKDRPDITPALPLRLQHCSSPADGEINESLMIGIVGGRDVHLSLARLLQRHAGIKQIIRRLLATL